MIIAVLFAAYAWDAVNAQVHSFKRGSAWGEYDCNCAGRVGMFFGEARHISL